MGVRGCARGLSAVAASRTSLDGEDPPHVAPACRPPGGRPPCSGSSRSTSRGPRRGGSSPGGRLSRALLAWRGHLTRPLALCPGHEVVAVAVATSIPEMHTPGGDDIEVVAGHPSAAGAGGTRQGADGALNYSKQQRIQI